jgi:hypothetical protein
LDGGDLCQRHTLLEGPRTDMQRQLAGGAIERTLQDLDVDGDNRLNLETKPSHEALERIDELRHVERSETSKLLVDSEGSTARAYGSIGNTRSGVLGTGC